jgi:hypothetical protein
MSLFSEIRTESIDSPEADEKSGAGNTVIVLSGPGNCRDIASNLAPRMVVGALGSVKTNLYRRRKEIKGF